MLSFRLFQYTYTVDPTVVPELLNEMWAKEPVGTMGITIALSSLLITLAFKLLDYWWDMRKERARQGKLHVELEIVEDFEYKMQVEGDLQKGGGVIFKQIPYTKPLLKVTLSNAGKEPIVVRDIGYLRRRFLGQEFIPVRVPEADSQLNTTTKRLPHALNARDLIQLDIKAKTAELSRLLESFQAKDSLGKLWPAPEAEIRRAKRQLKQLCEQHARQRAAATYVQTAPEPAPTAMPVQS